MESARLKLRKFELTDFSNMRRLESDPEVMRFTPSRYPLSEQETQDRLASLAANSESGIWAIERRTDAQFIGWIMLKKTDHVDPELGFMIVREHWNNGYAREAAGIVINHGFFLLNYSAIRAVTDIDNEKSKALLASLGFEAKSRFQRFDRKRNMEISLEIFLLVNPGIIPS